MAGRSDLLHTTMFRDSLHHFMLGIPVPRQEFN
jgi:hypothetical protein